jgi:photosystem II stability/assembly factor-like uncharacterized protein
MGGSLSSAILRPRHFRTAIIACIGGHVYRTTDGGSTWQVWDGGDLLDEERITNLAGYLP